MTFYKRVHAFNRQCRSGCVVDECNVELRVISDLSNLTSFKRLLKQNSIPCHRWTVTNSERKILHFVNNSTCVNNRIQRETVSRLDDHLL